jgi:hypothetical protein
MGSNVNLKEGHKTRKKPRLPAAAAWHRCSISDWIFWAY